MDYLSYPRFDIIKDRGILPEIPLPEDYLELVKKFYEEGRKQTVQEFAAALEDRLFQTGRPLDIRLNWDDEKGLTNISVGAQGGLDLEEGTIPHFREHNLGWTNGLYASLVAMRYVRELLISR